MKKVLKWLWWNFAADDYEKLAILQDRYIRAHREKARWDNWVGHSNECCDIYSFSKK